MKKALELSSLALEVGWTVMLVPGQDSAGNAFVEAQGKKDRASYRVVWHTRETGTYRLFHCSASWDGGERRDCTLKTIVDQLTPQRDSV